MDDAKSPIEVRNLHKSFGTQTVLNGIDLQVDHGQTVAVLGQSGSGKSVLLKLIIALESPDSGAIRVAGEDVFKAETERLHEVRKRVGFLFQKAALYDSLSVEENVAFPLGRHSDMPDAERRERVRSLLADVGMDRDGQKLPAQISGGMQKRVGLARALALDPDILLFDEPTAGLDPITSAEISQLILELKRKRKRSAVVVTHDVHSARVFADRFVLLHGGKITAEGTWDELQHSRDRFVTQFVGIGLRV